MILILCIIVFPLASEHVVIVTLSDITLQEVGVFIHGCTKSAEIIDTDSTIVDFAVRC